MAQVVEHLLCKYEFKPQSQKKKKKRERETGKVEVYEVSAGIK
jgi:hypothetical protein